MKTIIIFNIFAVIFFLGNFLIFFTLTEKRERNDNFEEKRLALHRLSIDDVNSTFVTNVFFTKKMFAIAVVHKQRHFFSLFDCKCRKKCVFNHDLFFENSHVYHFHAKKG